MTYLLGILSIATFIQAAVLLGLCRRTKSNADLTKTVMGMACRLTEAMGKHGEATNYNSTAIELLGKMQTERREEIEILEDRLTSVERNVSRGIKLREVEH